MRKSPPEQAGEGWLGDRKLAHEFQRLYNNCGEFIDVLSRPESSVVKTRRLRLRAEDLGRRLQRLSRVNLKHSRRSKLVDPEVPAEVKEQALAGLLRRAMWTCMERLQQTANVPPQERLRLLRRRLWLSGRRLELLSQAEILNVEEQARSVPYPRQKPELASLWAEEENGETSISDSRDKKSSEGEHPIVCYEVSGVKVWRMALRLPRIDGDR